MRLHLKDCKENFASVVEGRGRREAIYKEGVEGGFDQLLQAINITSSGHKKEDVSYFAAVAHRYVMEYLLLHSYESVDKFKVNITLAENATDDDKVKAIVGKIKRDFRRLTQVIRGYVFLVNVVMAGSANEFLYLTKEMTRLVTDE
ncbi:MAG: hypothetical protein ACJA0N_001116 [Pseudohongiellaceae bacterium]|jgi:hypothetical protein